MLLDKTAQPHLEAEEDGGLGVVAGQPRRTPHRRRRRTRRADPDRPDLGQPDRGGQLPGRHVVVDVDPYERVPDGLTDRLRAVARRDRRGVQTCGHETGPLGRCVTEPPPPAVRVNRMSAGRTCTQQAACAAGPARLTRTCAHTTTCRSHSRPEVGGGTGRTGSSAREVYRPAPGHPPRSARRRGSRRRPRGSRRQPGHRAAARGARPTGAAGPRPSASRDRPRHRAANTPEP